MKRIKLFLLLTWIVTLTNCGGTPKNSDWTYYKTETAQFTPIVVENGTRYVSISNATNRVIQSYEYVDIYYRYQDGRKYYAVKNQNGTICPDEKSILVNEIFVENFRWNDEVGELWIREFNKGYK